jgi:hypothetical protein
MLVSLAATLLLGGAAGCGRSSLRIGWREFGGRNGTEAEYVTFDGTRSETVKVQAGQTIELSCDVTVDKGVLRAELIAPDGAHVWSETFREDRDAFVTTEARESGRYILRLHGDKTGGGFDVTWEIS